MKVVEIDPKNPEDEAIYKAAREILKERIIIYPTETVYGIGGIATSKVVFEKICEIKGRSKKPPFLCLVKDKESLLNLVLQIDPLVEKLISKFWPGPLTLIFKAKDSLPDHLVFDGKIAARISSNRFCQKLFNIVDSPIISTSANRKGKPPIKDPKEIIEVFGDHVDLFVSQGVLFGSASTILDVSSYPFQIKREGAIKADVLRRFLYEEGFNDAL